MRITDSRNANDRWSSVLWVTAAAGINEYGPRRALQQIDVAANNTVFQTFR